jgi:hypothetical protein
MHCTSTDVDWSTDDVKVHVTFCVLTSCWQRMSYATSRCTVVVAPRLHPNIAVGAGVVATVVVVIGALVVVAVQTKEGSFCFTDVFFYPNARNQNSC